MHITRHFHGIAMALTAMALLPVLPRPRLEGPWKARSSAMARH